MCRICVALVLCLVAFGVAAEPNVPRIAESSDSYRRTIEARTVNATVRDILTGIQRARANKQYPELISLYEQLTRLRPNDFNAWLQLGLSWREAEPLADSGLGAAYLAYRTARAPSDQIE